MGSQLSTMDSHVEDSEVLARFDNVRVSFPDRAGNSVPVLDGLDLSIRAGSFTAIIGPSGCGKTTILNLLADAIKPTSGDVTIRGASPAASSARAGYLLARDALLPWRTAQRNVELPLEMLGVGAAERHKIASGLLDRVGLAGFGDHAVKALSHGMRQRVSLARILAYDPDIMLLDEPFSALDAQTRMKAQEFFLEVWQRDVKTVVLVTHDIQEAIFMADEVLTFSPRPARLVRRFTVDFPRPREIEQLRLSPEFNHLRRHLAPAQERRRVLIGRSTTRGLRSAGRWVDAAWAHTIALSRRKDEHR
jgi:NitT/TauT family transport system ATP-binding protein